MALVTRFSPLGNLNDLTTGPQLTDWSNKIESLMTKAVGGLENYTGRGNAQFADPSQVDMGAATPAPIAWFGFPATLAAEGYSKDDAYRIADGLAKDSGGNTGRDVQDEYLEWAVERDGNGNVIQIDFTTEGPEYWDILAKELGIDGLLAIYQRYYPDCTARDISRGGSYDPMNAFNNTKGAMHLIQANNNLYAEIEIAAQSTLTYTKGGATLISGADLCNYANLGQPTRNSDPHIAETVNDLARQGCRLSLLDPIGLYLEGPPDFTGWTTPDGSAPADLWTSQRGTPTTRGSLKAPAGFTLSDVKIGGQAIRYGGQVAELIRVQLIGLRSVPNAVVPTVVPVESLSSPRPPMALALALHRRFSRSGR